MRLSRAPNRQSRALTRTAAVAQTKALLSTTVGHLDFVKAVHVIPDLSVLVTASSDKDIRVWDLAALDNFDFASLTSTGVDEGETPAPRQGAAPPPARPLRPLPCLLALKAHTRPIEVLASYPLLRELPDGVAADEVDVSLRERTGRIALVSADSMGALKVWELWREEGQELKGELRSEVRQHEGGIYDLALSRDGEMWTGAVCLSYRPLRRADRTRVQPRSTTRSCSPNSRSRPPPPLRHLYSGSPTRLKSAPSCRSRPSFPTRRTSPRARPTSSSA